MKILLIGSGGREHALALKLKESSKVTKIYALPGNPGIWQIAEKCDITVDDYPQIVKFCQEKAIDLVVVGPEEPLIKGIANALRAADISVFGPDSEAAILEGSKAFSKDLMKKYHIPTADYQNFNDLDQALAYLNKAQFPLVVKASGIAAGKGVIICEDIQAATEALKEIMGQKIFGDAGNEVVIEEFLLGEEASIFAVTDGVFYKLLAPAQDHKRIYDQDLGPNTGGMGTYAPAPVINQGMLQRIADEIVEPTLKAMRAEGRPFVGVLFVGIMITEKGPKVIEYNCRFGDPETQVVLPLFNGDLAELLYKAATKGYSCHEILPIKNEHAVCVVMVSGGYPASYGKNFVISGLEDLTSATAIHAGTAQKEDLVVTAGGRVLGVVSLASDLKKAIEQAYQEVAKIKFDNHFYRKDIGQKGLKYYAE